MPVCSLDKVVSSHTLVLTLRDPSCAWPTKDDILNSIERDITDIVCSSFETNTTPCRAFITPLENNVLRLCITIETGTLEDGTKVHTTLSSWAKKTSGPSLDELARVCSATLGNNLPVLLHITGEYTREPCRGNLTDSLLPLCPPDFVKFTTRYRPDGSDYIEHNTYATWRGRHDFEVQTFLQNVLPHDGIVNPHQDSEMVRPSAPNPEMPFTLRTQEGRSPYGTTTEQGGNEGPGAQPFAEFDFPDTDADYPEALDCPFWTGLWGIALIAVIPFVLIFFRYSWYLGHRHAKKRERALIIEDEKRRLNGNPASAAEGLTGGGLLQGGRPAAAHEAGAWGSDPLPHDHPTQGLTSGPATSVKSNLTDTTAHAGGGEGDHPERPTTAGFFSEEGGPQLDSGHTHHDPNAAAEAYTRYVYVDPQTGESYPAYVDPNTGEIYTQYTEGDGGTGHP
ncbi:unnamed protein product [Phytomonas sp. Hart1]|nr:unnamed protein product [Phytomonas sp. Hart1]|eukprot:CCW69363.1 unnamed protein product [Phytomonas sp. isolate Hart1]